MSTLFAKYYVCVHANVSTDAEIEALGDRLEHLGLTDKLEAVAEQIAHELRDVPGLKITVDE